MTRPRYVIRRLAWAHWERLKDVPLLLTEVVDAMEALPPGELEVRREIRPPGVIHEVTGVVFGRRFRVIGVRDGEGRWLEVWRVLVP